MLDDRVVVWTRRVCVLLGVLSVGSVAIAGMKSKGKEC